MDAPLGREQRQWDKFFPPSVKLELFPVQACGFWLDPSQALHFTLDPGTCLAQGLVPGSPLNPPHHTCSQLFSLFRSIFSLPLPSPNTAVLSNTFQNGIWARPSVPPSRGPWAGWGEVAALLLFEVSSWLQPGQENPGEIPITLISALPWHCPVEVLMAGRV